jgi:hypothetical protein
LEGTKVTVNALHPGVVSTEIRRNEPLFTKLLYKLIEFFFKSAKAGAQTSIYAAIDPGLDNVTGKYFE